MTWVKIENKLPELKDDEYEEYNVYVSYDGDTMVTTLNYNNKDGWYDDMDRDWNRFVTHWKLLPLPPEDEDDS